MLSLEEGLGRRCRVEGEPAFRRGSSRYINTRCCRAEASVLSGTKIDVGRSFVGTLWLVGGGVSTPEAMLDLPEIGVTFRLAELHPDVR